MSRLFAAQPHHTTHIQLNYAVKQQQQYQNMFTTIINNTFNMNNKWLYTLIHELLRIILTRKRANILKWHMEKMDDNWILKKKYAWITHENWKCHTLNCVTYAYSRFLRFNLRIHSKAFKSIFYPPKWKRNGLETSSNKRHST